MQAAAAAARRRCALAPPRKENRREILWIRNTKDAQNETQSKHKANDNTTKHVCFLLPAKTRLLLLSSLSCLFFRLLARLSVSAFPPFLVSSAFSLSLSVLPPPHLSYLCYLCTNRSSSIRTAFSPLAASPIFVEMKETPTHNRQTAHNSLRHSHTQPHKIHPHKTNSGLTCGVCCCFDGEK